MSIISILRFHLAVETTAAAQQKFAGRRAAVAMMMVGMLSVIPSLASATYAPCVNNALAHTTGTSAGTPWYYPDLTLPAGHTYRYTYSTIGNLPLQNVSLALNGYYWTPLSQQFLPTSPNTLSFHAFIPPPARTLCSSSTLRINFERRQFANTWATWCNFDLKLVVVENGERRNLTYVKGISKAYYVGGDNRAHSLSWNSTTGVWDYAPVNVAWAGVQIDGQLASFADGSRVFFKGKNDKVLYNLVQSSGGWSLMPVKAGLTLVGGDVLARNSNEVVFYGVDNQLHRLILAGGIWTDEIVTPVSSWGPAGTPDGRAFALPQGSTHIFFARVGALANVRKVGNTWILEQISPPGVYWKHAYEGDLLAVESNAVYYRGRDNFIHRYTQSGANWIFDAMPISGSSENNVVLGTGYLTKFPGEHRVFYKARTGRIYNLYLQNGVWYNYSLSDAMTDAAGDLVAAEDKIFYINHDKRAHNFYWSANRWWDVPLSTSSQADTRACIGPYYS
jgi:hypothetical protein